MRYILMILIAFSAVSCDKIFKKEPDEAPEEHTFVDEQNLVGGDKDEHGCIGSAGYTWSELRQECIRVFERAYRLNALARSGENEDTSAFILFSNDKLNAELFLPDAEKSILLKQQSENRYIHSSYEFDKVTFSLKKNDVLIFQAAQIELKNIDEVDDVSNGL